MRVISIQKKATIVSSTIATALVLIKLTVGIASGSVAVLASAIDSFLDMIVSLFNYFAIVKSEEDPDAEYQYGKGKILAIAAVIEGTVVTVSGFYIIYTAFKKLHDKSLTTLLTPSIFVMFLSMLVTYFLVQYLLKAARETDSLVVKADALHYKADLWSNAAVLVALFLVSLTGFDSIDAIIGLAIGIYIIYSAYEIIMEGVEILLDRSLDENIVGKIEYIISDCSEVKSYHWLKTRTDGTTNFVEFHIVLRPDILLLEAHYIADEIKDKIIALDTKRRWIITTHMDSYDDEDVDVAMLHGKSLAEASRQAHD